MIYNVTIPLYVHSPLLSGTPTSQSSIELLLSGSTLADVSPMGFPQSLDLYFAEADLHHEFLQCSHWEKPPRRRWHAVFLKHSSANRKNHGIF